MVSRRWRRLTTGGVAVAVITLHGPMAPASAAELPAISAQYVVGSGPNSLAITPDASQVITVNGNSQNASIVTLTSGAVRSESLETNPFGVVVTPNGNWAYVSNRGSDRVTVINLATPGLAPPPPIPVGRMPGEGAVSGDGSMVFIPNGGLGANTISKIRVSDNSVTGTLTSLNPGCLTAAPSGNTFIACNSIAASVTTFTTTGTPSQISLPGGAATSVAFSPDSSTAYVTNSVGNQVFVISLVTNSVTATTSVGVNPNSIAVHPNGARVFVTNNLSSSLSVLSSTGALITTTAIVGTPNRVAVSSDGQYVLVTTSEGSLVVLDSSGTRVITTIALGGTPSDLEVSASGNFAAITLSDANKLVIVSLPPAEATGENIPTAPIQQYAPAPGEECGVNPPTWVDFQALGSLRTVGWGQSWAQWPNDGRGGTVCSRQPYYTSVGTWAIR